MLTKLNLDNFRKISGTFAIVTETDDADKHTYTTDVLPTSVLTILEPSATYNVDSANGDLKCRFTYDTDAGTVAEATTNVVVSRKCNQGYKVLLIFCTAS